jgi:hypothetical protein
MNKKKALDYSRPGLPLSQAEAKKIAKAAGFKPSEPYVNMNTAWNGVCSTCGTSVRVYLKHLRKGGTGCSYCAQKIKSEKIRIVNENLGLTFLKKMKYKAEEPFINKKTPWKMTHLVCGEMISPTLESLERAFKNKQTGCQYCSGKKVNPDQAFSLMIANNLQPKEKFPGANLKWKCRCLLCSRIVYPSYSTVKKGHKGCIYCSGVVIHPKDALKLINAYGYSPLVTYPGSESPWESTHLNCGRVVKPTLGKLKAGQGGCVFCRTGGFDAGSPAILYLMVNRKYKAAKIGISKDTSDRINQHLSEDWILFKSLKDRGDVVLRLEKRILEYWRLELKAKIHMRKSQMPQGGYTETVSLAAISLDESWKLISSYRKQINRENLPLLEPRNFKKNREKRDWRLERANAAEKLIALRGFNPLSPYPGVNKKWRMECGKCKTIWEPIFYNIRKGSGCPSCGRTKGAESNKVRKSQTVINQLARMGWRPIEEYPGVDAPWKVECLKCDSKLTITARNLRKIERHICKPSAGS